MPGFLQEHLRPLAGSAGLHVGLLALLGLAALRWTSSQPPVELAIQGYAVDAPVRPVPQQRRAPPVTQPPAAEPEFADKSPVPSKVSDVSGGGAAPVGATTNGTTCA